jgi:multidrug efflux pump subunit AcrA (membrane-fusion protein)
MKRWKVLSIILSCTALAGLLSCRPPGADVAGDFTGQLVEVVRDDLVKSVSGSGYIEVANEVNLSFENGGVVHLVLIEEGDEVNAGEILATLGPLDWEAAELAVTQAEAALLQAEYELDQAENPFTEEEIEDAEEAVDDAEDWLDLTEDMLRYVLQHGSEQEVLQWQMEVFRAESSLQLAEDTLDDILDAVDEDLVEIARKQVLTAEQALSEAQNALEIESLTAPFDAVVASVSIDEGDVIPPRSVTQLKVMRLIDRSTVELTIELDEIDVPGVAPGQPVMVFLDALPNLELEGEVSSVSPVARQDAGLVLFDAKISLAVPENSGVRVGMSADADIVLANQPDALLVPDRAINYDSEGNAYVQVVVGEEEQEIVARPVVIGLSDGFRTEIKSGLEEGELVLIDTQPRENALERLGFSN